MKRRKAKKTSGKPLKKQAPIPIAGVRVMQINSAITVPFFPVVIGGNTSSKVAPTPIEMDRALLHVSAKSFTDLVKSASAYPDVRPDVVSSFKAQVASGNYPSEDTMSGLAGVLSGSSD